MKNQIKQSNNKKEKIVIIALIVILLLLVYYALFHINNIVDKGKIKDTISSLIPNPDNSVLGEEEDNSNNQQNGGTGDGSGSEGGTGNGSGSQGGTGDGSGSQGGIGDGSGSEEDDDIIVDNTARFKVLQGTEQWGDMKQIDIFKNEYFNNNSIIAPGVSGKYNFTVENTSDSKFEYDLVFLEENPYKINMVYKLKVNGKYVVGNETEWVSYEKMNRAKVMLNATNTDLYTIEWKWEDAPNDTEIGQTEGANYKMNIRINATQVVE